MEIWSDLILCFQFSAIVSVDADVQSTSLETPLHVYSDTDEDDAEDDDIIREESRSLVSALKSRLRYQYTPKLTIFQILVDIPKYI